MYFCVGLIEEVSGKEKKFQRQYFDVCTSSANNIGVTEQTGQRCHLAMQICQWTTQPMHTSETTSFSQRDLDRIEKRIEFNFYLFRFGKPVLKENKDCRLDWAEHCGKF